MTHWHAGRILDALARYFDWRQNYIMPEYEIGGRADLIVLTRARYITEVEIKVSLADWRADRDKIKWAVAPEVGKNAGWQQFNDQVFEGVKARRAHISRFFYAIPETLENRIPDNLPEGVGILVVRQGGHRYGYDAVDTIREAVRRKSTPMPLDEFNRMMITCYYRYWNTYHDLQRFRRDRRQIRELQA
jgi:hypothetical protein